MLWLVDISYISRHTREISEMLMLKSEMEKLEGQHPEGSVSPLGPIYGYFNFLIFNFLKTSQC